MAEDDLLSQGFEGGGGRSIAASSLSSPQLYRKRVIFAHKDILRHRSEYFGDLLSFGSENNQEGNLSASGVLASPTRSGRPPEARQIHTIQCHDADFTTVYWLLHYLYTSELDFTHTEDVRAFVSRKAERAQRSARELVEPPKGMRLLAEWDWKLGTAMMGGSSQASRDERDTTDDHLTVRSAASASSVGTSISQRFSQRLSVENRPPPVISDAKGRMPVTIGSTVAPSTSKSPTNKARSTTSTTVARATALASTQSTTRPNSSQTPRPSRPAAETPSRVPSSRTTKDATSPTLSSAKLPSTHLPYPPHFHPSRLQTPQVAIDPNPHPTTPPSPASALAMYGLAHCYRLNALQDLAQNHLMENMTPSGAIPLLLATISYESLYREVQDYVVDNWSAVQSEVS